MVLIESNLRSLGLQVDPARPTEPAQRVVPALDLIGCVHQGCSADAHCQDCWRCSVHCRCGASGRHDFVKGLDLGLGDFLVEEMRARHRFRQRLASIKQGGK